MQTTLSKYVKAMRKQHRLTQVELSEKSGGVIPSAANIRDCSFITYPTVPANDDPAMILPIITKML